MMFEEIQVTNRIAKSNFTYVESTNTTKRHTYIGVTVEGEKELGAAFGTVGVLYILLRGVQTVQRLQNDKHLMDSIKRTVVRIMDIMKDDGILPPNEASNIYYVNFTQGSPGAIAMLCLAAEIFPTLCY
jgi:hypothetical protein